MKDHVFSNCTSLQDARLDYMTSSSIPVSVTEIESNAFYAASTPYSFVYEGTTAQFFAIKKGRGFSSYSSTAGRTMYVTTADGKTSTDIL